MTSGLSTVFIFAAGAFVYNLLPVRCRAWAILAGSLVALYWLQPALPIRFADFILPTIIIALAVYGWYLTTWRAGEPPALSAREDRQTLLLAIVIIVGLSFMRYVDADFRLTASRPPDPLLVAASLLIIGLFGYGLFWMLRRTFAHSAQWSLIALIAVLFIILKAEPLAVEVSRWWRGNTGQDTTLAAVSDLTWLGFSYIAFRLIHTLRDHHSGILPALSLREYLSYIFFFPALAAGPIDRAERFANDLRHIPEQTGLDAARFAEGFRRIGLGLLKKFVIADTLAQGLALNAAAAAQSHPAWIMWILLYGYGFRLFFDFSGYTDITLGIALLFGLRLPENFDRPYLRTTLTAFWGSWHITLSSWARFYVFSPLSRFLLMRDPQPAGALIVLSAHITTMILIGLWHGITWNFLIWGLWHGLGLFVHKQWSDHTRRWYRALKEHPVRRRLWALFSWFITFHYIMLGWVWFALPDTQLALKTLRHLFGVGG